MLKIVLSSRAPLLMGEERPKNAKAAYEYATLRPGVETHEGDVR